MVNQQEVIRWIEEGRTYKWMAEQYMDKYHLEVSPTMFSTFRARAGLPSRIRVDTSLTPWELRPEHRSMYPASMLRYEARLRAGDKLDPKWARWLENWKEGLERDNLVVHYDPDTEQGFWLVPRREGVDMDLIREPEPGSAKLRHKYK